MPFLLIPIAFGLFIAHVHRETEAERRHKELLAQIEASKVK